MLTPFNGDLGELCGDLGSGTAAFRAPAGARTLLGIWVALSWLGTFRVSGLGVVGIWAWSGSISGRPDETRGRGGPPAACLVVAPNAAGDLGKLCGDLGKLCGDQMVVLDRLESIVK